MGALFICTWDHGMRFTLAVLVLLVACPGWGGEYEDIHGKVRALKTTGGEDHSFTGRINRLTDLEQADLSRADLREANLQTAELSEANLRYANLQGADLRHASLFVTNLGKASLKKADLSRADFKKAILEKTDLSESNLYRADFRGADLKDADLRKTNLTGAKFQYAKNWEKADWTGAFFDPAYPPKWPRGFPDPKTLGIAEKDPDD